VARGGGGGPLQGGAARRLPRDSSDARPGTQLDPLLDRIDAYLDAVPRALSRTEEIGPLILFVSTTAWPYYARPRRDAEGPVRDQDVRAVLVRQAELGVPVAFEWVTERTPGMPAAASAAGLRVSTYPLLVLDPATPVRPPVLPGVEVRALGPDDDALAAALAVQHVGFAAAGTGAGPAGIAERDAVGAPEELAAVRSNLRGELSVVVVAGDDRDGPLCVGMHQPVGAATEIVGVATLPAARRRGLGAAVTAALVLDARARGAQLVFLSAGSDDVARVYERVGFRRVGHAGAAEPA
jgi:ribosomal protein S18 acetylase RimI-like enzyme